MVRSIQLESPEAAQWNIEYGTLTSLIVLASASRIESLAILRLRLRGRQVISMPMAHKHFHFVRHAGMYHHLVEDFPHAVASITLILRDEGCMHGGEHCSWHSPLQCFGSATHIAWLHLAFSAGSAPGRNR